MAVLAALARLGAPAAERDFWIALGALAGLAGLIYVLQGLAPLALTALWLIGWLALAVPVVILFANRFAALGRSPAWGLAAAALIYGLLALASNAAIPAMLGGIEGGAQGPAALRRRALPLDLLAVAIVFAAAGGLTRLAARRG